MKKKRTASCSPFLVHIERVEKERSKFAKIYDIIAV